MSNPTALHIGVFYIEFGFSNGNIVGSPQSPESIGDKSNYMLENPASFDFHLIAAIIAFILAALVLECFTFENWIWNPNFPRVLIEMEFNAKKHSP